MIEPCVFSPCRKYRYTLWREWKLTELPDGWILDVAKWSSYLMVIGLNPSTADDTQDDPTIRRCIRFAKDWGFGRLLMTNAFAYRSTDPLGMKTQLHPVGPENNFHLLKHALGAGMVLAAWGKHGTHQGRQQAIVKRFQDPRVHLHCLGTNKDGTPKHPLYIAAKTQPVIYQPE